MKERKKARYETRSAFKISFHAIVVNNNNNNSKTTMSSPQNGKSVRQSRCCQYIPLNSTMFYYRFVVVGCFFVALLPRLCCHCRFFHHRDMCVCVCYALHRYSTVSSSFLLLFVLIFGIYSLLLLFLLFGMVHILCSFRCHFRNTHTIYSAHCLVAGAVCNSSCWCL